MILSKCFQIVSYENISLLPFSMRTYRQHHGQFHSSFTLPELMIGIGTVTDVRGVEGIKVPTTVRRECGCCSWNWRKCYLLTACCQINLFNCLNRSSSLHQKVQLLSRCHDQWKNPSGARKSGYIGFTRRLDCSMLNWESQQTGLNCMHNLCKNVTDNLTKVSGAR